MAGRFANLRGTLELLWKIGSGQIDASALTAQRSYALPDKGGTFALLDDITGGGDAVRREFRVHKTSDTGIALPEWAEDGGAIIYLSGCGGGGAGGTGGTSAHGGTGAEIHRLPLPVPASVSSYAVTIGAGGVNGGGGAGGTGGQTSFAFTGGPAGPIMNGGNGASNTNNIGGAGGIAAYGSITNSGVAGPMANSTSAATFAGLGALAEVMANHSSEFFRRGSNGFSANNSAANLLPQAFTGPSAFGFRSGTSGSEIAYGFGVGGGGRSSAPAQDGRQGIIILEIVEVAP